MSDKTIFIDFVTAFKGGDEFTRKIRQGGSGVSPPFSTLLRDYFAAHGYKTLEVTTTAKWKNTPLYGHGVVQNGYIISGSSSELTHFKLRHM